jgi:hypothetical protein
MITPKYQRKEAGIRKCAAWLIYCLSIGWDKSALDGLEKIWWTYKDGNGNLKRSKCSNS